MQQETKAKLIRDLIVFGLIYWIPAAAFIWLTSLLGDCFETEAVCEAGRREGMITLTSWFGGFFVIAVLLRLRLSLRH